MTDNRGGLNTYLGNTDDEPLDLTDDMEVEDEEAVDNDDSEDTDDGEETVIFGDEVAEEPAADVPWAKHLRSEQSRLAKENRELRQQIGAQQVVEQPIVVGDRPTEGNWNFEKFDNLDQALDHWLELRDKAATQAKARDDAKRKQDDEWGKVQQKYQQGKAALRIHGVDDAEATALAELSPQQQAVIAKHADNPALFIVALGKNPAKLQQIASIEDPFALTKAMTKMEATLKQTKTTRPPDPDRRVQGKAISAESGDKKLAKLEAEAAKTNNRQPVIDYKASLRSKSNG